MFSIIISEKGGAERREYFSQAEVSVGRIQGNDLVLAKGNVSKRHCRVEFSQGRFTVTDQNSTNGTYLNRRRISQSTVVRQGDRIYIGDFVLRIEEGVAPENANGNGASLMAPDVASPNLAAQALAAPATPGSPPAVASAPRPEPHSPPQPDYRRAMATTTNDVPSSPASTPLGTHKVPPAPLPPPTADTLQSTVNSVRFIVERVAQRIGAGELRSADPGRVDSLIADAIAELQQQASDGALSGVEEMRAFARAELLELGPLGPLLDDPSVVEIVASSTDYVTVQRTAEQREAVIPFCASGSLQRATERLCASEGVPLSSAEQLVRRELETSGFTLDFVRGSMTPRGPLLWLRRRDQVSADINSLVQAGAMSRTMATFLQHCVEGGANLLVVGPSRSGAVDVLSALACASTDRCLALVDDTELLDAEGRISSLVLSDNNRVSDLMARLATLPGHRLVVDGMHQPERAVASLSAVFSGATGLVARLNSRSIERGLTQLCSQIALSKDMSARSVAEALAGAFDLVIEVSRLRDGRTRVLRVAELSTAEAVGIAAHDIFAFSPDRVGATGSVEGSFNPTGRRPQIAAELKIRGVRMDSGVFGRVGRAPYPSSG